MEANSLLIEALPCAYIECDDALRISEVNQKSCALLRKSREELIGRTGFDITPEARGTEFETFFDEVLRTRSRTEIVAEFPPFGGVFHMIAHPENARIHLFISDITQVSQEREEAQARAVKMEGLQNLLSVILEGLREGVIAIDTEGAVIFSNAASRDILGRSYLGADSQERQTATRPLNEAKTAEIPLDQSPLLRALNGEDVDNVIEWVQTPIDGREALVNVSASPLRDREGRITGAVAWFRDITELRHQRRQLQESERRHRSQSELLRRVIDGLHKGLVVFDRDANVVLANNFSKMFLGPDPEGLPRDELVAEYQQVDPQTGRVMSPLEYASAIAMKGTAVLERETIVRGGHLVEEVILVESSVPLRDETGEIDGAILWFRDVTNVRKMETEREELRKRLAQAQKMEAVGQLAGGIAHDFNNLLTVILGNAEALIEETQDSPKLREFGEMTSAAALRAAELTHRLLAFSRQQPLEPKITDVKALVSGLQVLIKRSLGEAIDLHVQPEPHLWTAMVDPGQLENAIINLAVNARDAMPNGGRKLA